MIVIPYEAIELEKGENITDACKRIESAGRARYRGRLTTTRMKVEGAHIDLAASYAPTDRQERPSFMRRLRRALTTSTVLGIDANCVPDPTIDVWCTRGWRRMYNAFTIRPLDGRQSSGYLK